MMHEEVPRQDLQLLDAGCQDYAPSRLALAAGRYAIVSLSCPRARYVARLTERRDILFGIGDIYDRPLATFEVNAGEVVDIGHLELLQGISPGSRKRSRTFSAVVKPTPETALQKLAESHPDLYKARVTRLMVAPGRQ